MISLDESLSIPCEGIFWWIDNDLVYFADNVDIKDPFSCTDLLHKATWQSIKDSYKVNGHTVSFDYFPRGRVETCVYLNDDGTLNCYDSFVYMDACICNDDVKDKIIDAFRLYLPKVSIHFEGQLFVDGSHYVCHYCRKDGD